MLNKAFRNNGFVVSVGNGLGSVLFPCPPAGLFLRPQVNENGVSWWGCGNYGWNVYDSVSYNIFTDGNCGEYSVMTASYHAPTGHVFYDTGCCQVHYDGGTSYYIVDNCNPPCPPAGTPTGVTQQINPQYLSWTGCDSNGSFLYRADIETQYHDGSCSYYWMTTGFWNADDMAEIYNKMNCCYVRYRSANNSYEVADNCGCPESGTLIRSESSNNDLNWSGCGNSGTWTYSTNTTNYYADGFCGEYSAGGVFEQPSGTVILDTGCCQVYYTGSGNYSVTDNCNPPPPPPPEYPSAGTILSSSSSDITTNIMASGNDIAGGYHETFHTVSLGTAYSTEYADGNGGSYWSGGNNYLSDGTTLLTGEYGLVVDLSWAVTDGGGSYSGSLPVALNVPTWVMSGGSATTGPTSFIDKLSEGYIIFETNEWWNGDANVKTRVEYQNGGGYITTTITF